MTQLQISLTDEAKAFVERTAQARGLCSASDYIQELVERERVRSGRGALDALLLEGLDSGEALTITDEWWERKRTVLAARIARGAE